MRKYYPDISEDIIFFKKHGIPCTCGHTKDKHEDGFCLVKECTLCYCPKYEKNDDWDKSIKKEEQMKRGVEQNDSGHWKIKRGYV